MINAFAEADLKRADGGFERDSRVREKMNKRFNFFFRAGLGDVREDVRHRRPRLRFPRIGEISSEKIGPNATADLIENRGLFRLYEQSRDSFDLMARGAVEFSQKKRAAAHGVGLGFGPIVESFEAGDDGATVAFVRGRGGEGRD